MIPFSTFNFVTPAKAGVHHRTVRPVRMVQAMDSRLRGNDEMVGGYAHP